jgi:phasin family protein
MASDGPKPVMRGKPVAKDVLPGLPGAATPAKRGPKAKLPASAASEMPSASLPDAITPAVVAAAVLDVAHEPMPHTSAPESVAAAPAPEPVAPAPVITPPPATEPVAATLTFTNPQPTAPVFSVAHVQKEETMEATMQDATTKTQAMFGDVNERAKSAMEKSSKMFEEMNAFGKGNVEAMVESGKIAAKGLETLGQDAAEYTRKQFENTTAIMKSMASVKSPTELFKMQSDFIRQSFDSMVAESSKNTEAMLKLVGEIAQPLSNRVALAAEKAKIAA